MNILHVIPFKLKFSNGIQASAWSLAKAQACLGHQVLILSLGRAPTDLEIAEASRFKVRLIGYSLRKGLSFSCLKEIYALIKDLSPSLIVHFHSVFIPQHSFLAYFLNYNKIPYFIKFGGNYLPKELQRRWFKKLIWRKLIEGRYIRRARGIIAVSPQESMILSSLFPSVAVHTLPNPVGLDVGAGAYPAERSFCNDPPRGCFFGKKDVFHKGIDRLLPIALQLNCPIDLFVINSNQAEKNCEFDQLLSSHNCPAPLSVNPPVYGLDKTKALLKYDYYIHPARWEVYGVSIIEALLAGLPVIISKECDLACYIEKESMGLVIDFDKENATELIREYILNKPEMQKASLRGIKWATEYASPINIAKKSITFYTT